MSNIKEGNLYKTITVADKTFQIYYGYYSENERAIWEPAPIFPDFLKNPVFTDSGLPFTRADQDVCPHYSPKPKVSGEEWCNDCKHFKPGEDLIGICRCSKRKDLLRQNE